MGLKHAHISAIADHPDYDVGSGEWNDDHDLTGLAIYDVKAYGATGDGTTDDTTAIQAAISAASLHARLKDPQVGNDEYIQGATVFFPTGLYSITTLTMAANVTLRGAGFTSGRAADDAGAYLSKLKQRDNTNAQMIFVGKDTIGVGFFDLVMDGNRANQSVATNAHGIEFEDTSFATWTDHQHAPRTPIVRCAITNILGTGIKVGSPHIGTWCVDSSVSLCGVDGIWLGATDCRVLGSLVGACDRYGINVRNGTCHISADIATCLRGIHIEAADSYGCTEVVVSDSLLGPQNNENIYIGATVNDVTISHCILRQASVASSGGYAHVLSACNNGRVTISGCSFHDSAAKVINDVKITGSGIVTVSANVHEGAYAGGGARTNAKAQLITRLGNMGYVTDADGITLGGTAFPASPATGMRFWRTDRNLEYEYNGTRWLTTQLFTSASVTSSLTATTVLQQALPYPESTDKWLESIEVSPAVVSGGTALDGSNKWVLDLTKSGTGGTGTSIAAAVVTLNSGVSDGTYRAPTVVAIGALMGATFANLRYVWTKTGTPGNLNFGVVTTYRLVG